MMLVLVFQVVQMLLVVVMVVLMIQIFTKAIKRTLRPLKLRFVHVMITSKRMQTNINID